jgi:FMN phosphatase YigB (HAD superfamily)
VRSFFITIIMLISIISRETPVSAKIVLWDLGGVLFEPSKIRIGFHIGIWKLLLYKLRDHKDLTSLRHVMFHIFNETRKHEEQNIAIPDDEGKPLCNVLCDFQAGICSSEQILTELNETIKKLDAEQYFSSSREREIIEKTIESIFDPNAFSQFMQPINQGVNLLALCCNKKTKHGTMVHEMMCISNWDRESYELLCTLPHGQRVFQYFKPENVIVSGMFGDYTGLKPSRSIFEYIIKRKGVPAHEFIYIDDQKNNIRAAQACGMTTVHLNIKKGGFPELRRKLKKLGIL